MKQKPTSQFLKSFLFLLLFFVFQASAQHRRAASTAPKGAFVQTQTPVTGSLVITPPYPGSLSSYANPAGNNGLSLILRLNDIAVPFERVRLKVYIEQNNSLVAQSSSGFFGEMITLTGGIPQTLTGADLAPYFKLENLEGVNPNNYAQSMPEGLTQIYFTVEDYFTGRQVSGNIEAQYFLLLNQPPLLNTPFNESSIPNASPNNPQIVFSWTPRATQVSNTDYQLTIVQINDPGGDINRQLLSAIPFFKTTVSSQTSYLYGITDPPLLEGKTYAWQVKAMATPGFGNVGTYANNGNSEIYEFVYASACTPIPGIDVTIDARATDRLYVSWIPPSPAPADGYKVAYRKYSAGGTWEWQEQATTQTYANIFDLEPNTQYEVRVGKVCDGGILAYSDPQKATTLSKSQVPNKIDCGKVPAIDISNQNPLAQLNAGDVVMAGDFPVTILSASGSPGTFSGEGWVKVPWLADTKIHVKYQNIKVNTDRRLIGGYFETVYNPNGKNIASVDTLMTNVQGLLSNIKDWITDTAKASKNIAIIQKTVDSLKAKNPNISDSTSTKLDQDVAAIKALPTMYASASGNDKDAIIKQAIEDADKLSKDIKGVSNQSQPTAPYLNCDYYVCPNGYPIKIDDIDIKTLTYNSDYAPGTLAGYTAKNGKVYEADISPATDEFLGYQNDDDPSDIIKPVKLADNSLRVQFLQPTPDPCTYTLSTGIYVLPASVGTTVLSAIAMPGTMDATTTGHVRNCANTNYGFVNHSEGGNGTSPFSTDDLTAFNNAAQVINTDTDNPVKVYLLNKANPNYDAQAKEADDDKNSTIVATYDETQTPKLHIEHTINAPKWLTDLLPDPGPSNQGCTQDYINAGLDDLHKGPEYMALDGSPMSQCVMEIRTVAYRSFFGMWYCATNEDAVKNSNPPAQFVAGALHEIIGTVDVEKIRQGLTDVAVSAAKASVQNYIDYYHDVKQTFIDIKTGTPIPPVTLLTRMIPPPLRDEIQFSQKVVDVAKNFSDFYFTNCGNICAYRYGQATVIIVPIVLTAGEWAIAKAGTFAAAVGDVAKAEQVVATLRDAEVTIAEGSKFITVTKDADAVTTTGRLPDGSVIVSDGVQTVEEANKVLESLVTDPDALSDAKASLAEEAADNPDIIKDKGVYANWARGRAFNQEREPFYPYNEVYVNKPNGSGYKRLDSFDPEKREIVSRKCPQFDEIKESTAKTYLNEIPKKYPANTKIADVPSNQKLLEYLKNNNFEPKLAGQLFLEVPVQTSGHISQGILDYASQNKIYIRDINGKIFNPKL